MNRTSLHRAFTLIEMITVIAIIAILAGLVLSVNGLVQRKAATSRADAEIRMLSSALKAYETDNGGVPQDPVTDSLDPRISASPASFQAASLFLYKKLSGDENANGKIDATETAKNYAPDFFRPSRLGGSKDSNGQMMSVTHILDPFGNSYGYSTAGLKAEQDYRSKIATSNNPENENRSAAKGYNPTFDLWSTGGSTSSSDSDRAKWIKNW
jgi:prepilin-type N-terminal cleavage/methylation domain-containing protein